MPSRRKPVPDTKVGVDELIGDTIPTINAYLELLRIEGANGAGRWVALQALQSIVACHADEENRAGRSPAPGAMIAIPWWVAVEISKAWDEAKGIDPRTLAVLKAEHPEASRELEEKSTPKSLDAAFAVPRYARRQRRLRDLDIALAVAIRQHQGMSFTAAFDEVGDRVGLSASRVEQIWETHRDEVSACLRNHLSSRPEG